MIALVLAVFTASVLGSLHCAGMCGAFLAFAVGDGAAGKPANRAASHAAYHGGRLATYTLLGLASGWVGALLNLTSVLAGVQPVAAALAGGVMIVFGVTALMRLYGLKAARVRPPALLQRAVAAGHRSAMGMRPVPRAAVIGLLTTLLPCGWLYAFAVTAAGTGSAAWGAAVMAVFWAGTLPVMVSLGLGLQGALGALGRRLPAATCVMLIAVGGFTLTGRLGLDAAALAAIAEQRARETHPAGTGAPDAGAAPACCELSELNHGQDL